MSKNIVICCDGTSNDTASDSTNVLRLYRSLERNEEQLTYYDAGVGTVADPTKLTWLGKQISRKIDMGMGHSVRENACKAYRFLCEHYEPGDRIYLFGFSRGAYTVRTVAGMIRFLGLARPELKDLDRLAWTCYADDDKSLTVTNQFGGGSRFKKAFAVEPETRIHFIGVFDTVSTFGFLWDLRSVPFTDNNDLIDHVRHAMAIDEYRTCFQPCPFDTKPTSDGKPRHKSIEQRWFAGAHADVGGGYPETKSGLAKITLKWMYEEAEKLECRFDGRQKDIFLGKIAEKDDDDDDADDKGKDKGKPKRPKQKSRPNEMGEVHPSMEKFWHILEFLPRKQWDNDLERMRWFAPNLYRRRTLPQGAILDWTVGSKLQNDPSYNPTNLPKRPKDKP